MAGGNGAVSSGNAPLVANGNDATAGEGTADSGGNGTEPQPANIPTIAANQRKRFMLEILLEALLALVLLLAIVWWTMFSGRKSGELPADRQAAAEPVEERQSKTD